MSTNYLAKLAAWTVKCPMTCLCGKSQHHVHHKECPCNGSGKVLDPRFEGLRELECPHCGGEGAIHKNCEDCDDKGYIVNRDLEGLLACVGELYWPDGDGVELTMLIGTRAKVQVGPEWHDMPWVEADTAIEAVAQAVYEWLEGKQAS